MTPNEQRQSTINADLRLIPMVWIWLLETRVVSFHSVYDIHGQLLQVLLQAE
jgi:hypothetical protein